MLIMKKLLIGLFFIPFLSYGEFLSVCGRTLQVKNAIMEKVAQIDPSIECSDDELMPLVLSEIKSLILGRMGISSLIEGDFSGLSSLQILDLGSSQISSLPQSIFSELSALIHLNLSGNQITSLPQGIFSNLPALKKLHLVNNQITSLPEDIFSELSALEDLWLSDNPLDEQTKLRLKSLYGLKVEF